MHCIQFGTSPIVVFPLDSAQFIASFARFAKSNLTFHLWTGCMMVLVVVTVIETNLLLLCDGPCSLSFALSLSNSQLMLFEAIHLPTHRKYQPKNKAKLLGLESIVPHWMFAHYAQLHETSIYPHQLSFLVS